MQLFISVAAILAVTWFAAVYAGIGDKLYKKIRRANEKMNKKIITKDESKEEQND